MTESVKHRVWPIEHRAWRLGCGLKYAMLYALCTVLLMLFPSAALSDKKSDTELQKKQIEQIKSDLDREKEKYEKFDFKEKGVLDQLAELENDITRKKSVLRQLKEKIKDSKKELNNHRKRLNELEASLMHIESLLNKRLVSFYKNAKRGYLKILSTTNDLDQLNHNMKYLRVIMTEDKKIMTKLIEEQSSYRVEASKVQEQLEAVSDLEKSEQDKLASLKEDLEKKVILLAKIHKEKEFYEVAVLELQSAAENLKNTINNLGDGKNHAGTSLPVGFGKNAGKLPAPLEGKILNNISRPGEKSFNTHKGVYIEGEFGSPVNAVFPGRVDFSGTLKGYGQVVIINHGERYYSISAYLLERNANKGDMVFTGDVIGFIGESGLTSGPALYFEIRKGEKSLNPLKWIKVN